ncbi:MAG TPA: hypothetical protein VD836_10360 [Solirubrobacteraceae bacterium]|nr:hypothetical protein [Solirubrobacteraceae bacterium]
MAAAGEPHPSCVEFDAREPHPSCVEFDARDPHPQLLEFDVVRDSRGQRRTRRAGSREFDVVIAGHESGRVWERSTPASDVASHPTAVVRPSAPG